MTSTTLVCTDGSDLATAAATAGLSLLRPADTTVLVTVVIEPTMVLPYDASGMAGAAVTPTELTELHDELVREGQEHLDAAAHALGLHGAQTRVLTGEPGRAICDLAAELGATAVIIGSRGRGGIKRAVLGSVSDHVVRHAPCPVLVSSAD